MPSPAPSDPSVLDQLKRLPNRAWLSVWLVLAVTALNAFNDNILKMMLVGLAPKVAAGALGSEIGAWLGAMILLPFIIFAPLAGYFADRYSKRGVIIAMLVAQAVILLITGLTFQAALGSLSIMLALGTFFLLAAQSTFFSPGKMGILKELTGSRRLGMVSGWLQMVTMIGILCGLGVGGAWFDSLYEESGDPWAAAATPIWILFGVAMIALAGGLAIQKTPAHPHVKFHRSLLWEHFLHLKESLSSRGMRRAFFGNATYWFVASMVAAMFVDIGIALFPDVQAGGAASASSRMTLMVGIGTVVGSLFVSWVNRRGLQLGLIPLGALGLAGTLIWAGCMPLDSAGFDWALAAIGFTGGCYMVPIQTYIQDRADAEKRGRVLSSMNLLDSLAGVSGVLFLVLLKLAGFGFRGQFWTLGALMLIASVYVVRLLPQDLVRLVILTIVRAMYRVKSVNPERVPPKGGVLLLPNHVSYVDAVILGTACERPVRFVMWDALYKIWWMNWFLRIVGTVPISATRAKDAVRTVAAALKEGEAVCLFPEGQITRHGMINELRKGFELMARQAEVPVLPVYMEGLYGSIFSYEGGRCFKKWPKRFRYPVCVHFGHALPPREATTEAVRAQLYQLGNEALLRRIESLSDARTSDPAVIANAVRLTEIEWAHRGETLLCVEPPDSALYRTLERYTEMEPGLSLIQSLDSLASSRSGSVIAVGTSATLLQLASAPGAAQALRCLMHWDASDAPEPAIELPVYRGLLHPSSGALLAVSVPDPVMPESERGNQLGVKPGSLGRLLPGLDIRRHPDGLEIVGATPNVERPILLQAIDLDEHGFLIHRSIARSS